MFRLKDREQEGLDKNFSIGVLGPVQNDIMDVFFGSWLFQRKLGNSDDLSLSCTQ